MGPPAPLSRAQHPAVARSCVLLKGLILPAVIVASVLGTIYAGLASVTEAAGMGVVGVLFAAVGPRRAELARCCGNR